MKKFLMAAATAAALACAAPAAQAATTFNLIDQTVLDNTGTENFGATIDTTGVFNHSFTFTTTGKNDASGFIGTIRLSNGGKDLDLSSIDLDGTFAFVPVYGAPGHEPDETWNLFSAVIGPGSHTINVHGNVVKTSGTSAASYAGTLNVAAVPEPATWGLMIFGFGSAGAVLRRRRTLAFA